MPNPFIIVRGVKYRQFDVNDPKNQFMKIVNGECGPEPFWTDIREKADSFTQIEAAMLLMSLNAGNFNVYYVYRAIPK